MASMAIELQQSRHHSAKTLNAIVLGFVLERKNHAQKPNYEGKRNCQDQSDDGVSKDHGQYEQNDLNYATGNLARHKSSNAAKKQIQ
jgi:hypothetical protein